MSSGVDLLLQGLITLFAGIAVATFTYYLGKVKGAKEHETGFDKIPTQIDLNKTKWEVSYEDIVLTTPNSSAPEPSRGNPTAAMTVSPPIKVAVLDFTQAGSRILGDGRDMSGRRWIVEGAAAERRVCYIYYERGGAALSMGAVLLLLNNSGRQMTGEWLGWSPESNELGLRKVNLKRIN